VFHAPRDEGVWLGVAETPTTRTYLRFEAPQDTARTTVVVVRVVSKSGGRWGPFSESHSRIWIDCAARRARIVGERGFRSSGEEVPRPSYSDRERPFSEFGARYALVPICVRLGRSGGRFANHSV
jgi:hypothetical protein